MPQVNLYLGRRIGVNSGGTMFHGRTLCIREEWPRIRYRFWLSPHDDFMIRKLTIKTGCDSSGYHIFTLYDW